MSGDWEFWGCLVLGGASVVLGTLVRLGFARRWLALYWQTALPKAQRHVAFTTIPFGLVFLLWFAGLWAGDAGHEIAGIYVIALSLPVAALGIYIQFRAPWWAKPAWVREAERAGTAPRAPVWRLTQAQATMAATVIVALAIGLFVATGSYAGLLIGLGTAAAIFSAIEIG